MQVAVLILCQFSNKLRSSAGTILFKISLLYFSLMAVIPAITRVSLIYSFNKLKTLLKKEQITSRFLTIGFTGSHDAAFLSQVAMFGSELGNFFYVNTDQSD